MSATSLPRGMLPDDPLAPVVADVAAQAASVAGEVRRIEALVSELRDKLDGARGLTPEGETALVARVGRAVDARLSGLPRSHLLRTGLFGAALLLAASGIGGGIGYALGHSRGASEAVMERCRGEALRESGGGLACSFWVRAPAKAPSK